MNKIPHIFLDITALKSHQYRLNKAYTIFIQGWILRAYVDEQGINYSIFFKKLTELFEICILTNIGNIIWKLLNYFWPVSLRAIDN